MVDRVYGAFLTLELQCSCSLSVLSTVKIKRANFLANYHILICRILLIVSIIGTKINDEHNWFGVGEHNRNFKRHNVCVPSCK